ncbi:hypothetical protein B0O80DRAFT_448669 [Mortierella sp. GBAus27b]|nr:hypothetical protein B0O80DRAFT_448669 [Mortierella sp. GBAus27b]
MRKKPVCRTCRSKKFRQSGDGYLVCELGHQLEGHQIELGDDNYNPRTIVPVRRLKSRKRKRKETSRKRSGLRGQCAQDLTCQGLQLILRKQLYALVHDLGFPPELEVVAHEFWMIYLSSLRFQNKEEFEEAFTNQNKDQEVNEDEQVNNDGMDYEEFRDKADVEEDDPDAVDRMEEYQRYSSHGVESSEEESEQEGPASSLSENENDGDADDQPDDNDRGDNADVSDDQDTEDDDDFLTGAARRAGAKHYFYFRRSQYLSFRIAYTPVICFFAALHLKLPVVLGDFVRWAAQRKIPYYDALYQLPSDMAARIPRVYRGRFYSRENDPKTFYQAAAELQVHLSKVHGVYISMPNMPPLVMRFVQELMLPVEVSPCALSLCRILFENTKYDSGESFRRSIILTQAPVFIMSVVVVVAKLFLGLDGKKRTANDDLAWIDTMPKERDWLDSLNAYESLKDQTFAHGAIGELEDLMDIKPDLYVKHAAAELQYRTTNQFPGMLAAFEGTGYKSYKEMDEEKRRAMEQNEEAAEEEDEESVGKVYPSMEAFIRRLNANVQQPKADAHDDMDQPRPLKYGEGYVHYLPNGSGAFLGSYERLMSYACNILAIEPDELQRHVAVVEQLLVVEPREAHIQALDYPKIGRWWRK